MRTDVFNATFCLTSSQAAAHANPTCRCCSFIHSLLIHSFIQLAQEAVNLPIGGTTVDHVTSWWVMPLHQSRLQTETSASVSHTRPVRVRASLLNATFVFAHFVNCNQGYTQVQPGMATPAPVHYLTASSKLALRHRLADVSNRSRNASKPQC